jgi:uroporphyrinogen decarboxylase
MDPLTLKKNFGDKLTFWGGIDTQKTLSKGSPDDVRSEVCERIAQMGQGGGYVVCASHNIQADVPPENVLAMVEAAKVDN